MESRNVTLTLEKAKEFYNSGNSALKEIALQAYTKEELTTPKFTDIKTFEQAAMALGMCPCDVEVDLNSIGDLGLELNVAMHLKAIYKLDIIRKALNGGWNPSLVEGRVYYPFVRFYPAGKEAREAASSNNWKLGETFKADGQKYTLVGGGYSCCYCDGLANFGCGCGDVLPNRGLLGCKSQEIAEHMSRYFSKEIFEATYAHHVGTYQWV